MDVKNLSTRVKYEESCWSLTPSNQSTTSTVIPTSAIDDLMINCISQPIKLDDHILINEPRSHTEKKFQKNRDLKNHGLKRFQRNA
ncbi:unnamed protein product [Rotaria sp. Silwood2]|nr:unnamed protein product [Rotaria sp. Silwood2]CAF3895644.1 unnamed protein product [Rotaria sp. Silwood2]